MLYHSFNWILGYYNIHAAQIQPVSEETASGAGVHVRLKDTPSRF
jgi:hypothetical protein